MAFLSSFPPGEWALGDFWGLWPMRPGRGSTTFRRVGPAFMPTPEDARKALEITLAIQQAVKSRKAVPLTTGRLRIYGGPKGLKQSFCGYFIPASCRSSFRNETSSPL